MSRGMSGMYGNLRDDTVPLCLCSVNLSGCKITKHLSPGFQGRFGMCFPESIAGWETQKFFYWRLSAKEQTHGQSKFAVTDVAVAFLPENTNTEVWSISQNKR